MSIPPYHNVVQVLDFFSDPQTALLMEFVNGEELSDYLTNNSAFSAQSDVKISIFITAVLVYLHSQGVVYRDLKSESIEGR